MYGGNEFNRWRRHPWHGLAARPDANRPDIVKTYVEITPTDVVKYEIDKQSGFLMVDRPQRTTSSPPALYGFIPQTYCGERVAALCEGVDKADGDPLDIVVYAERLITKSDILLNARVVGGFQMIDDGEADDKILAILEGDNIWGEVNDIEDVPSILVERLQHYFYTYKMTADDHLPIRIREVYGRDRAIEVIDAAMKDYQDSYGHLHGSED